MKGLWTKDIRLISSQQKNLAVIWLVAAGILIATDQNHLQLPIRL